MMRITPVSGSLPSRGSGDGEDQSVCFVEYVAEGGRSSSARSGGEGDALGWGEAWFPQSANLRRALALAGLKAYALEEL